MRLVVDLRGIAGAVSDLNLGFPDKTSAML